MPYSQSHLCNDEVAAHVSLGLAGLVFWRGGGGSRTKPINGTGVWTRLPYSYLVLKRLMSIIKMTPDFGHT